jgi:hypothetical protein
MREMREGREEIVGEEEEIDEGGRDRESQRQREI